MSKKRTVLIIIMLVLVVGAAGAGWYVIRERNQERVAEQRKAEEAKLMAKAREELTVKTQHITIFKGKPDSPIVTVDKNEDIVWQNLDSSSYTIVFKDSGEPVPNLSLAAEKDTTNSFAKPGLYTYQAEEKPELTGTIEVY